VDILIELARDANILGRTWIGWSPYVWDNMSKKDINAYKQKWLKTNELKIYYLINLMNK